MKAIFINHTQGLIRLHHPRNQAGSQISEFGAGLVILVVFILVPILNLVVVPIRWMMAQEMMDTYARKLAMCETLSQSFQLIESDPSLSTRMRSIGGIEIEYIDLSLKISRSSERKSYTVKQPQSIPPAWLPDAGNESSVYSLELETKARLFPAIVFNAGQVKIPGLTEPIPLVLRSTHKWGNLGRDPRTGKFFINE